MKLIALATVPAVLALTAAAPAQPADAFFANLSALCGKSFEGRVVTTDAADADFAGKRLVMKVEGCTADQVRIPFSVGEDRSRTWVVTRTATGLRLKHDHRHADGTEDELSQYGGDTDDEYTRMHGGEDVVRGTATRQTFPADRFSKELFLQTGRGLSATNVWALEVHPGHIFAYELKRANRHFRVEFDLTKPVGG